MPNPRLFSAYSIFTWKHKRTIDWYEPSFQTLEIPVRQDLEVKSSFSHRLRLAFFVLIGRYDALSWDLNDITESSVSSTTSEPYRVPAVFTRWVRLPKSRSFSLLSVSVADNHQLKILLNSTDVTEKLNAKSSVLGIG